MQELPRTLPLLVLDESARSQIGYLAPPLSSHFFRHPRLDADRPPPSLLESEPAAMVLPRRQMEALSRELPEDGDLLMAVGSPWKGKARLQEGLRCFSGKGRRIHAVVSEELLEGLSEDEITRFLEQATSIISLPNRLSMDEQLGGCLEAIAAVLATSSCGRPKGLLSWQGSRHFSKPALCLQELVAGADRFCRENDQLVASIESSLQAELTSDLESHGLGGWPLAVGRRECGARVGILRTVSRKVVTDE